MKFAQSFRESLASQDFPPHWIAYAIPYGQLKKCLKKVQRELQDLGLDQQTLQSLCDPANTTPLALKYRLNTDSKHVRPMLTVNLSLKDREVIGASLTPESRIFFERIASELTSAQQLGASNHGEETRDDQGTHANDAVEGHVSVPNTTVHIECETFEVPLVFDSQFFRILHNDVSSIDDLQATEKKKMDQEIANLGSEISQVTKPTRFSKTDLDPWRHILELYIDAEVFFATQEQSHGARSSQQALKQLQWFQSEVEKRQFAKSFKLRESQMAFVHFLRLNASLLKNLQFQELNQLAVRKILKKFDKRTSFSIAKTFRGAVKSHQLMAGNVSRDVCAQLSQELLTIVPQINDFLCPICFAVAYRPVRLECQHVFCIRCIVKIQRRREKHCPLCRAEVVMKASTDNLDNDLAKQMKTYFRKEVREKQDQNELERGIEDYGPSYKPPKCTVM
jgi:E3 ubiquitin-protein ligase BAH